MKVIGIAEATGAELDIALGFHPDRVYIRNLTDRTELMWERKSINGQIYGQDSDADGTKTDCATAGAGCILYDGSGGPLAAADATILRPSEADQANAGTLGRITGWTLGSAANKTGNFNVGCNTATVGPGSRIFMGQGKPHQKIARITAITNDGDAANEVTLDIAVPTGAIDKIFAMWDFLPAGAGDVIQKGIRLGATVAVNDTDGDVMLIIAETFDRF